MKDFNIIQRNPREDGEQYIDEENNSENEEKERPHGPPCQAQ